MTIPMRRSLLTLLLKPLLLGVLLLWHTGAWASEIGSGDTAVSVAAPSRMSDTASLQLTPGTPGFAPNPVAVQQTATVNFQVALSWPDTAPTSVQQERFDITDLEDGTITAIQAPADFAVTIDDDKHSATLTRMGGSNHTAFSVSIAIAYASAGAKPFAFGGAVIFNDDSAAAGVFGQGILVGNGASATYQASSSGLQTRSADPVMRMTVDEALLTLAERAGQLSFLLKGGVLTVSETVVVGATSVAIGAYAIIDGVVYWHTIDTRGYNNALSVGPFTAIGRADVEAWELLHPDPGLETHLTAAEIARITIPLQLSVKEALQIAQDRAQRKKTDVCRELGGMEWLFQRKQLSKTVSVIKAAEKTEECANDKESIVLYHYTDLAGYKAINSSGTKWDIKFVANQPRHPDKPFGVYFTTLPPNTKNLAATIKASREKIKWYFKVILPRSKVLPIRGGKGTYIWYSPTDITVPKSNVLEDGSNPFVK